MENMKSKVYILIDEFDRVIRCEGGYTMQNIQNIDDWILIDEGEGDKYNLCQTNYFEGGLFTSDGIYLYKWDGTQVVLRSEDEIEADRIEASKPSVEEQIAALKEQLSSTDYKIIKCSEAQLVGEELPYDITALHAERQAIRNQINELEGSEV
jgi:hypothetical protein